MGKRLPGGVVSREVVGYAELRAAEVAQVEVYHAFLCLDAPCVAVYGRCHDGMSLAPHAVVAYVDKGDMRLAVVPLGHGADERLDLGEEYGVVVFGLLVVSVDIVSHGPRLEYPFGGGAVEPALHGADAEGHHAALVDPPLCGGVEQLPHEAALLGLDKGPRHAQVDGTQPGKVVNRIGRVETRAVVVEYVRVEVHRPSHVGVYQREPVVLGPGCHAVAVGGDGSCRSARRRVIGRAGGGVVTGGGNGTGAKVCSCGYGCGRGAGTAQEG